jgi:predicted RNase H-like nuclease (RuvC/YqgF family)
MNKNLVEAFDKIEKARKNNSNIFEEAKKISEYVAPEPVKEAVEAVKSVDINEDEDIHPDHIARAIETINTRIGGNHKNIEDMPDDLKTAAMNLARNYQKYNTEEVKFSSEEIEHIKSILEAMPIAPTSTDSSPSPTPKNKAEGGRGKGSLSEKLNPLGK